MNLLAKIKNILLPLLFVCSSGLLFSQPCTDGYGMNLGGIAPWTSNWYFVNIAHHSLGWFPPNQSPTWGNWYSDHQLTPDKYLPTGQSGILSVIWDTSTPIYEDFVLTYTGTADVGIYLAGSNTTVTLNQPGRIEFTMNGGTSLFVEVTANSPSDNISDLRITKASEEQLTQTFSPQFLQEISHYQQLRFMDWGETNNSPVVSIQDYPPANALMQRMTALEKMIELANLLNVDPWFCIPLQADDGLVTSWAQTIKNTLNPNLNVRIELSNEVWNGIFSQHAEAANLARQLGLQNTGNNWEDAPAYFGHRSAQIHTIFETEFASGGPAPNLVKVIAWQAANSWFVDNYVLPFYRGVCGAGCVPDEMAIAPYFSGSLGSPANQATVETWDLNTLFDQIENGTYFGGEGSLQTARDWVSNYNTLITNEGIPAISIYEGGQHLSGNGGVENNQTIVDLFIDANKDPRMGDMYTLHLNDLKAEGVSSIAMFASHGRFSKWGSWGLKEYVGQPDAQSPKHVAYRNFIQNNPLPPNCGINCPQEGQPCDDNDSATLNDKYDNQCTCKGTALLPYDGALRCTNASISIDGAAEKAWNRTNHYSLTDPSIIPSDLSADWALMYDEDNLYVWVDVMDNEALNDSGADPFDDDAVELFLDPDYSRDSTYDGSDIQLVFRRGDPNYYSFQNGQPATFTGVTFGQVDDGTSYQIEIQIPWSALGQTGVSPTEKRIGFALKVDDDDDGLARDDRLAWFDPNDMGWSNPTTFGTLYTGKCAPIDLWVNLEGALTDAINPRSYLTQMRTDLNTQYQLLPGQQGGVTSTPAGQPYDIAPWNYMGMEGADFLRDEYALIANDYGNVPIVDWVLVGFRTGISKNTEVAAHAALLQADGHIIFLDDQVVWNLPAGDYYIQIEHRNHMGVLSPSPVVLQNGRLQYDFRSSDSWKGTLFGQKQIDAQRWAMFMGDGNQTTDIGYDVNGNDRIGWQSANGQYGRYQSADHNMNGDVNGADRILWNINSGFSSVVPR